MRTSFSPFGSLKNLYWALNHQFKGSTNTGSLKADSRHRIIRLRGEECLTLPSNSMAKIKCPFVAFVLILLCAVTSLDTPFPDFTYHLQIWEKKMMSLSGSKKSKTNKHKSWRTDSDSKQFALGDSSAQHWILVLLHTSLHTSWHVV